MLQEQAEHPDLAALVEVIDVIHLDRVEFGMEVPIHFDSSDEDDDLEEADDDFDSDLTWDSEGDTDDDEELCRACPPVPAGTFRAFDAQCAAPLQSCTAAPAVLSFPLFGSVCTVHTAPVCVFPFLPAVYFPFRSSCLFPFPLQFVRFIPFHSVCSAVSFLFLLAAGQSVRFIPLQSVSFLFFYSCVSVRLIPFQVVPSALVLPFPTISTSAGAYAFSDTPR